MEGDEDDNPPLLVGVEEENGDVSEEELNVKVPITIVTGRFLACIVDCSF